MTGSIFNIQKFCLHDGPGIRTTVFFKGCNLRCKWCANPESQRQDIQITRDKKKCVGCGKCAEVCPQTRESCIACGACVSACPNGAIGKEGRRVTAEETVTEVMKDKAFYDHSGGGVTFSGGEVLLQWDFAKELAARLKAQGVHIAVETAGAVPESVFLSALKTVDYVLMDLKHYDSAAHLAGTGMDNTQILKNLECLQRSGVPFLVRIPVIPGFNDTQADAEGFAKRLTDLGIYTAELLPFHQLGQHKYELLDMDYAYAACKQLHREDLMPFREVLIRYGMDVKV